MVYISKPHGTHAVFHGSKGAWTVHRLVPGTGYQNGPPKWSRIGDKTTPSEACDFADQCDENRIEPVKPA